MSDAAPRPALPRYRCHKIVEAGQITSIEHGRLGTDCVLLHLKSIDQPVQVTFGWLNRHTPAVEGYLVRYEDGYESFSPREAFEEGYQKITLAPVLESPEPLLRFFKYSHLPPQLQAASRPFAELAQLIVQTTPRNAERTLALRDLLAAKDNAVRAHLQE